MNALNKQELQIIEVFSSMSIPDKVFRDSNIKDLISGMLAEQKVVATNATQLEQLRKEKKEGNLIGNWWEDRDAKIQDAQLDLNQTIGRLTQKSSQLLIVNTAISKGLTDQQRLLLKQQNLLEEQTTALRKQNQQIIEQQNLLEAHQQEINKANQGLLEAKGITQEQAQQLVGCVKLVKEAEHRINHASHALQSDIEQSLKDSVEQCLGRLNSGFAEQEQRYGVFEQQLSGEFSIQSQKIDDTLQHLNVESTQLQSALNEQLASTISMLQQKYGALEEQLITAFSTQATHTKAELAHFLSDTAEFKAYIRQQLQSNIEALQETVSAHTVSAQQLHETVSLLDQKYASAQNEQAQALKVVEVRLAEQKSLARRHGLTAAVTATLALVSLGWQLAQYFALM